MAIYTDTFIESIFGELGLSDKESTIYLTCLQWGEIGVIELARITHLSRSTAYFIADQLITRGLLRFIQKGAHRVYAAEDPRKILTLLDQESEKLLRTKSAIQDILPTLNMRYAGAANKPLVSYYVGRLEMRQIFEDALILGITEMLFVGETSLLVEALGRDYMATWNRRKVAQGIVTKGIWPHNFGQPEELFLHASQKNLRQVRYAPTGFRSPTYTLIYANKVAFLSSAIEAYGTLIESHDLSRTMRNWFKVLWERSTVKVDQGK